MADTSPEKEELLPLPSKDLPLPEKELTANNQSRNFLGSKWLRIGILAVIIAFAVSGAYFLGKNTINQQVACTQEAKICPDGSSVGRTGPKCEFAPCPVVTKATDPTANWTIYDVSGFSFKYPADFRVEERVNNYFGVVPIQETILAPTQGIFIDARLSNGLEDFQSATTNIKSVLTDIEEMEISGGIKISGVVGPGFGQGQSVTEALLRYKNGALSIQKSDPTISEELFDQILSTFKFTDQTSPNPTCTPRPACLDATPKCLIPETPDMCPATVTPSL